MQEIDFAIDETDPEVLQASGNFSVLKAHRLLQEYLQTAASDPNSVANTASQVHRMLCAQDGDSETKESRAEWEHGMFTHVLLDLVGKIPHSHRAQQDLVNLLVMLKSSTKLNSVVNDSVGVCKSLDQEYGQNLN